MRICNPTQNILLVSPSLPSIPAPQSTLVIWEIIPLSEVKLQESHSCLLDTCSFLSYCVQVSPFIVWGGIVWGLRSPLII